MAKSSARSEISPKITIKNLFIRLEINFSNYLTKLRKTTVIIARNAVIIARSR